MKRIDYFCGMKFCMTMKTFLLPHKFQYVGWTIFVPAIAIGCLIFFSVTSFSGLIETIVNDAAIIGIALGSLFIVCSRDKIEDEMTRSIRLASLLNTLYIYTLLLVATTIFVNGIYFMSFAIINLVLLPIIFVVIFKLKMQRYYKITDNEE